MLLCSLSITRAVSFGTVGGYEGIVMVSCAKAFPTIALQRHVKIGMDRCLLGIIRFRPQNGISPCTVNYGLQFIFGN